VIRLAIRLAGTAAGLAYVAWRVDFGKAGHALATIPVATFAAAVALVAGNVVVGAVRWRVLMRAYGATDIPGVTVDYTVAPEYRQTATSVLAINQLQDFGFPYDDYGDASETAAKRAAFQALYAEASGEAQALRNYVGNSGGATLVSSESYPQAHDLYVTDRPTWNQTYDDVGRSTARDLREIAKIIYAQEAATPLARHNSIWRSTVRTAGPLSCPTESTSSSSPRITPGAGVRITASTWDHSTARRAGWFWFPTPPHCTRRDTCCITSKMR